MDRRRTASVTAEPSRRNSVSWFVFFLVGSSAVTLFQLTTSALGVPITLAVQAALLSFSYLLFLRRPFEYSSPRGVVPAVALLLASAFAALAHALVMGSPDDDVRTSFLFMYSTALAMVVFIAGPAVVRLNKPLTLLLAAACAFGVVQALNDNLFLPADFKDHYGIVYERFVNGRVRVLSFFPSAPRFAEVLVFVLLYITYALLQGARRRLPLVAVALLLLVVLYNTFSRSGYLFGIAALLFLLVQGHAKLRRRSDGGPAHLYYAAVAGLLSAGLYLAAAGGSSFAVADTTSLEARLYHWTELKAQFDASGPTAYLFGTGSSAYANAAEAGYFVIDNVFYAFAFYGGILGFLAAAWLYWRTVRALSRTRLHHHEVTPLVALLSALPVEGLFVDNHNTLLLGIFIAIGVLNRYARDDAAAAKDRTQTADSAPQAAGFIRPLPVSPR